MKLQTAADGVTVVAGLATLVVIASIVWPAAVSEPFEDVRIDESVGIDFSLEPRTLIAVLQSGCGYCQESAPFYRRLLERDTAGIQVVVAAPSDDAGIGDYLASANIEPDAVVLVTRGQLPVPSTPTLLLVDGAGVVTHAWVGLLSAEREADLLDVLFG